jgi:uncharacterized protein YcnI
MRRQRPAIVLVVTVSVLMVMSVPALAHIGTNPGEVPAGETSSVAFRVGHGCDDSPTVSVAMQIPAGVTSVAPKAKPGWSIEVEEGTLPEPVDVDGETITEGVVQVTWTGGSLDSHQYDEFEIRARFPEAEGETVYFPVVQTCEEGEHAWIQIPEEGGAEPEEPAPGITLTASAGGGEHASSEGEDTETDEEETADEASAEDRSPQDGNVLSWAGLVLGGVGAALGGMAFASSRRKE